MIEQILKYKDFFEIIAAVGTFLAAAVALYTLREIKKQRLSLYKPALFLKSFCVIPKFNPLSKKNDLLEYKVLNYNDYSQNSNKIDAQISVLYKLENLGFGVAKDIKCIWEFDYKKAILELEKFITKDYEVYFYFNFYGLRKFSDEDFHRSASIDSFVEKDIQKIDFISPINISDHNHKHTVPSIILFSYIYYLIFKNNLTTTFSENYNTENFKKMPKPKLVITYKDLNGKTYKKNYTFNISAASGVVKDSIDMDDEPCVLYFLCE